MDTLKSYSVLFFFREAYHWLGGLQRKGREDGRQIGVANAAHHYEVIAGERGGTPNVAAQQRDLGNVVFGLPARDDDTSEFGVVRNNQHARALRLRFRAGTAGHGWSVSASSTKESSRLVLIPRFTAASVFLMRFACSTRP